MFCSRGGGAGGLGRVATQNGGNRYSLADLAGSRARDFSQRCAENEVTAVHTEFTQLRATHKNWRMKLYAMPVFR